MNFRLFIFVFLIFQQLLSSNFILSKSKEFYCFTARFYDSKLGRFVEADPVVPSSQSSRGLNHYAYVYGNPLKFKDPSGNMPVNSEGGAPFALVPESNPLNLRLDFNSSGQQIQWPVVVNEDGSQATHAIQPIAFGIREDLKTSFSFELSRGRADGLIVDPLLREAMTHNGPYGIELENPVTSRMTPLWQERGAARASGHHTTGGYFRIHEDIPSLRGHQIQQLPFDYPNTEFFNNPMTIQRLQSNRWSLRNTQYSHLGLSAGLSQTPVYFYGNPGGSTQQFFTSLAHGARIPSAFGGIGGLASVATYITDPNPFYQIAGVTLGGTEIVGALTYYAGALEVGSGFGFSASGVAMMRGGAALMGFAGFWGMALTASWFLVNAEPPFSPNRGPMVDFKSMLPEKRQEAENSFIDPGIFGPGSM